MNVTQASWTSKARTWLLLAALTALFIGIGFLLGGAFTLALRGVLRPHERRRVLLVGQVRHPRVARASRSPRRRLPTCTRW